MPRIAMTIGRFQPHTRAHEILLEEMADFAKENGIPAVVYMSSKSGDEKNPLPPMLKETWMKHTFHYLHLNYHWSPELKSAWDMLHDVAMRGYTGVDLFLGSDEYKDFNRSLVNYVIPEDDPQYEEGKHIPLNTLNLHCVGDSRNPEGDEIQQCSATAARKTVKDDYFAGFLTLMPSTLSENDCMTAFVTLKHILKPEEQNVSSREHTV